MPERGDRAVQARHPGGQGASYPRCRPRAKPHLAEDGTVLSAQNGLNEIIIAEEVGAERTVGCFVNFGADWLEPGPHPLRQPCRGRGRRARRQTTDAVREYHRLLRSSSPKAVLTDNIWGYLWGKLGYGSLLFATALTNASMSENLASERHFSGLSSPRTGSDGGGQGAGREAAGLQRLRPRCLHAGCGRGSRAPPSPTWRSSTGTRPRPIRASGAISPCASARRRSMPRSRSSRTLGQEAGIPTPAIGNWSSLIHDIEDGRREQSWSTLDEMLHS